MTEEFYKLETIRLKTGDGYREFLQVNLQILFANTINKLRI